MSDNSTLSYSNTNSHLHKSLQETVGYLKSSSEVCRCAKNTRIPSSSTTNYTRATSCSSTDGKKLFVIFSHNLHTYKNRDYRLIGNIKKEKTKSQMSYCLTRRHLCFSNFHENRDDSYLDSYYASKREVAKLSWAKARRSSSASKPCYATKLWSLSSESQVTPPPRSSSWLRMLSLHNNCFCSI